MRVIMGFAKKETPQSLRTRREGCSSGAGTRARCTLARCCATLKHTLTAFEKGNGITGLFLERSLVFSLYSKKYLQLIRNRTEQEQLGGYCSALVKTSDHVFFPHLVLFVPFFLGGEC